MTTSTPQSDPQNDILTNLFLQGVSDGGTGGSMESSVADAKAALLEVLKECKPPLIKDEVDYLGGDFAYDRAILEYEQNIINLFEKGYEV